jgi:hypothetical protein
MTWNHSALLKIDNLKVTNEDTSDDIRSTHIVSQYNTRNTPVEPLTWSIPRRPYTVPPIRIYHISFRKLTTSSKMLVWVLLLHILRSVVVSRPITQSRSKEPSYSGAILGSRHVVIPLAISDRLYRAKMI